MPLNLSAAAPWLSTLASPCRPHLLLARLALPPAEDFALFFFLLQNSPINQQMHVSSIKVIGSLIILSLKVISFLNFQIAHMIAEIPTSTSFFSLSTKLLTQGPKQSYVHLGHVFRLNEHLIKLHRSLAAEHVKHRWSMVAFWPQ